MSVVGSRNDDERLFTIHVGFNRLPHTHDLALGLNAGKRALFDFTVFDHHFIDEFWIGKGRTLCGEVISPMGRIGIKVLFGQTHLREIFACCTVEQDGVRGGEMIGRDVVGQDC